MRINQSEILGITMGDSSGVGPEILLKSFAAGKIRYPIVIYGDLAALQSRPSRKTVSAPSCGSLLMG
jgi:4-hydroxy-L-threonine phosphate dehydrogenase PdxA